MRYNLKKTTLPILSLALIHMACASTPPTQDTTDPTEPPRATLNAKKMSPEECKRRVEAMAKQDQSMRSSPQEIVDTSTPPRTSNTWDPAVNPCPEQGTTAAKTTHTDPVMTRTQIQVALKEQEYTHARALLPSLFTQQNKNTQSLRELTTEVSTHHLPLLHNQLSTSKNIAFLSDGSATCVATKSPEASATSVELVDEIITGATLHVRCGLPPQPARAKEFQLLLRTRKELGEYEIITVQSDFERETVADKTSFTFAITLPEDFLATSEQAYMEVFLLDQEHPKELSRAESQGSFFWFKN